jgi:hypothetical protein
LWRGSRNSCYFRCIFFLHEVSTCAPNLQAIARKRCLPGAAHLPGCNFHPSQGLCHIPVQLQPPHSQLGLVLAKTLARWLQATWQSAAQTRRSSFESMTIHVGLLPSCVLPLVLFESDELCTMQCQLSNICIFVIISSCRFPNYREIQRSMLNSFDLHEQDTHPAASSSAEPVNHLASPCKEL